MSPKSFSNSAFTHAILLDAPVSKIFPLVSTANGLRQWFLGDVQYYNGNTNRRNDELPQVGDQYDWQWKTKDFGTKGEITAIEVNKSMSFTFGSLFEVVFHVEESISGGTKFLLKQQYQQGAEQNEFAYINCCVCWVFFMSNMKSVVEQGVDLRELQVIDEMLVNQ